MGSPYPHLLGPFRPEAKLSYPARRLAPGGQPVQGAGGILGPHGNFLGLPRAGGLPRKAGGLGEVNVFRVWRRLPGSCAVSLALFPQGTQGN